jgi:LCP family protein required for cell wall assembly
MSDAPQSPPPPPQQPQPPSGPPDYKVYRSRKRLRDRAPSGNPLDALRNRRGRRDGHQPGPKRRITPGRVLKWVVLAALGWILVSIVVFVISSLTAPSVSERTERALSPGGAMLAGSTILVLGSDERPKNSKEPGANEGRPRADSILLMRVGFGSVRKLSILRDTQVDIPGHGTQKVNAAFALGGTPLMIRTLEGFFGDDLRINHVINVSFTNFPELIDALGGVDVELKSCLHSNSFGGETVRLRKGEHHLSGQEALRFARVRQNRCNPNETDEARARRQQDVLAGMRSRITSPLNWPSTFVRAPFIAWEAPRAIRSDMQALGLSALFVDLVTGGTGETRVLAPDQADFSVSEAARSDALDDLLGR